MGIKNRSVDRLNKGQNHNYKLINKTKLWKKKQKNSLKIF